MSPRKNLAHPDEGYDLDHISKNAAGKKRDDVLRNFF